MRSRTRAVLAMTLVALAGSSASAAGEVVLEWNQILLDSIRTNSVPPPRSSRAMAMVQLAVYDAVNSFNFTYDPYDHSTPLAPAGASPEAAAASAAASCLTSLFPGQAAAFATALNNSTALIPEPARTLGINHGNSCANLMTAARSTDHSTDVVPYVPGADPGDWIPTPPANAAALLPHWPTVTPFGINNVPGYRHGPPPALGTPEYAAAVNEVKAIGKSDSATRTADQTEIARFWAAGGGTITPPGLWNQIAQTVVPSQSLDLVDTARTFAMMNAALADAAIVSWDHKYEYNIWRPITAIRLADTDGNALTDPDPTWSPLLTTPNFPGYTSGHSTFSAAAAAVLASLFGDAVPFTFSSDFNGDGIGDFTRSFTSFTGAADEAALSRLYGGIHFSFDNNDGSTTGDAVGDYIAQHLLQVPGPGTMVGAMGLIGLGAMRRRRA